MYSPTATKRFSLTKLFKNLFAVASEIPNKLVPCTVVMNNRLDISRFGYISIRDKNDIEVAKGHEFHYSKLKTVLEDTREFKAVKKDGRNWECIFHEKNMYAGYPHIHFFGSYKLLEELF